MSYASSALKEMTATADQFDFEREAPVPQPERQEPVSYQASDRYLSFRGRLGSVWSVLSSSLRLGMIELKTENDLSTITKALSRLNDRQLRVLGFDDRDDLVDEVRELIGVQEAIQREREAFEGRSLGAVQSALGHAV